MLSRPGDGHAERVQAELDLLGASWIILDPGAFPASMTLSMQMSYGMSTHLKLPDGSAFHLEEIGAVWYRRPSPIKADHNLPALQQTFIEREARSGLWGMLRTLDSACFVNHPGAIHEAAYKPYQLVLAQRLGLLIPRTLLTNNPDEFRRFYEQCQGKVIYKLLGFPAYEVEDGAVASTYTSYVPETLLQEAHRIKATAHLFQEFQEKAFDLRVILIGEKVFAVEIHPLSAETRLDFRRDYRALRYAVHTLPAEIEQALLAMTRTYGLQYAAIDLLYTVEKQYLFLELNAVGQLGWLEEPTGLPLFASLARLLAGVA